MPLRKRGKGPVPEAKKGVGMDWREPSHEVTAAFGGRELPRFASPLTPLVDMAARIRASVHTKLLGGFLVGAMLLLGVAVLSTVVINRMSQRVTELTVLQDKVDRARQMEYLVTAQSHFRAMALLTRDDANNAKIATAKAKFAEHLDVVEGVSQPAEADFFRGVREANSRFTAASAKALDLYAAGDIEGAMRVHLTEEHPISHELEAAMRGLESNASRQMEDARAAFQSDRSFLTNIVWTFTIVSLALALLLGFVLSWAFIRPVRQINRALAQFAGGDFTPRVEVPNRDEFGTLSKNLEQLANLYRQLHSLNDNLQQKVEEQIKELQTAQGQLDSAATLAAIDQIAGGVAHDLRNPLGAIKNAVYYLKRRLSTNQEAQSNPRIGQFLQIVEEEVEHSNQIINDFHDLRSRDAALPFPGRPRGDQRQHPV